MAILEKEDSIQLIGFYVGQKLFGADIRAVQEILRRPDIEPLPQVQHHVEGVVRLRGDVIPVIDLESRLGGTREQRQEDTIWVLITNLANANIAAGFMVNGVTQILRFNSDNILPAPDLILDGLSSPYIRGVCNTEAGLLIVLDFERMLTPDEIGELKKIDVR